MIERLLAPLRNVWENLIERLLFLPPFPESIDSLALFSLLLVVGLLLGEWLHAHFRWPKVIGYVLAGIVFGPSALGWISIEALAQARPIADAALGLLMMEVGRRLDLSWLHRNPELLRSTLADISLSFALIFAFALWLVGLSPAWAAATAAVTMASAPAVVLLTIEESRAQGQVTERIILHTAISSAASRIPSTLSLRKSSSRSPSARAVATRSRSTQPWMRSRSPASLMRRKRQGCMKPTLGPACAASSRRSSTSGTTWAPGVKWRMSRRCAITR